MHMSLLEAGCVGLHQVLLTQGSVFTPIPKSLTVVAQSPKHLSDIVSLGHPVCQLTLKMHYGHNIKHGQHQKSREAADGFRKS